MPWRPFSSRPVPRLRPRVRGARIVLSLLVVAVGISLIWASTASSRSSAAASDHQTRPITAKGDVVLLVGDSLLWQSTVPVTAALRAESWEPTIAAAPGTTIGAWTARMAQLIDDARPDVVVVELGTNNCDGACPHIAATIDRLMRHVPRETAVYWLNVQAQPTYPAHPESVNDALAAAKTRWPNLDLVDMSAHFRNHPEWHSSDGIHFSAAGSDQLGLLIAQALHQAR